MSVMNASESCGCGATVSVQYVGWLSNADARLLADFRAAHADCRGGVPLSEEQQQ